MILDINASKKDKGPNIKLLSSLKDIYLSTPLIYGGGIRNKEDAKQIIQNGADRIVIETLANENRAEVKRIANEIGIQAIIRSICIVEKSGKHYQYNYLRRTFKEINLNVINNIKESGIYSELMIIDIKNEGEDGKFNSSLVDVINSNHTIAYGGVGTKAAASALIAKQNICAIAIGNQLNYAEESIFRLKNMINSEFIRRSNLY